MEFTAEQKLYADIVQKAWEDANFKKALVENPVETIEKFSGKKLNIPEGKSLKVRFVDDLNKDKILDDSYVYFDIPNLENMELNQEQLEVIAGGSLIDYLIDTYNTASNWFGGLNGKPRVF